MVEIVVKTKIVNNAQFEGVAYVVSPIGTPMFEHKAVWETIIRARAQAIAGCYEKAAEAWSQHIKESQHIKKSREFPEFTIVTRE